MVISFLSWLGGFWCKYLLKKCSHFELLNRCSWYLMTIISAAQLLRWLGVVFNYMTQGNWRIQSCSNVCLWKWIWSSSMEPSNTLSWSQCRFPQLGDSEGNASLETVWPLVCSFHLFKIFLAFFTELNVPTSKGWRICVVLRGQISSSEICRWCPSKNNTTGPVKRSWLTAGKRSFWNQERKIHGIHPSRFIHIVKRSCWSFFHPSPI